MAGPCRASPAGRPLSPARQLWGGEQRGERAGPARRLPSFPAGEEPPGPGEPNPFSFRAFVRSQGRGAGPEAWAGTDGRAPQEPFLPDPTAGRPLEEEAAAEEWSGSYRPSAVERAHFSRLEHSEPWPLGTGDGEVAGCPSLQPTARELQEENARLRSTINKLHFLSETQADKVRKLERKLEENKIKEQKEARDLEAMVQHVEQNLQLMTKRAVKAENNVVKLKQENALLQVQLKNYKTENEALKTGQSASLAAVKQNADIALQNLVSVITNSHSSIKQLVSGAESLQIVAELLKSIDRISEISDDGS
uniref:Endosome-associated-trafficking regulator 1 n=1 Tax=Pelusios castaneus TaxID=367368 RepID=A0A8C8R8C9_9SAUR